MHFFLVVPNGSSGVIGFFQDFNNVFENTWEQFKSLAVVIVKQLFNIANTIGI